MTLNLPITTLLINLHIWCQGSYFSHKLSLAQHNALLSSLTACPHLSPPTHRSYVTRSQQRITIVGAHLAPEEPEKDPLVLGVFKPKNGVREKLRETLHNVLAVEMAERSKEVKYEEEGVTSSPNAVTISKNTRYAALSTAGYDITAGNDLHDNTDVTLQTVKFPVIYLLHLI